jgi:DnaJ-class molecular chaperone
MSQVNCPECRGRGEIPCPLDYGGGDPRVRIECPYCDGDGKVED